MTTMRDQTIDAPVRKTISVKASLERAFHVFTQEFDSWWPRTHHIGKAPMRPLVHRNRGVRSRVPPRRSVHGVHSSFLAACCCSLDMSYHVAPIQAKTEPEPRGRLN
jgi:hypothetical protein